MPNWCDNNLVITTNNFKLRDLIKQSVLDQSSSLGFFENLLPLEECEVSDDEDDSLYFQALRNWGTKWDVIIDDYIILRDDDVFEITLSFQTAWSPPINFLQNLASRFISDLETKESYQLDVALYFMEMGNDFCGIHLQEGICWSGCDLSVSESIANPNDDFLEIIKHLNFDLDELSVFYNFEDENEDQE